MSMVDQFLYLFGLGPWNRLLAMRSIPSMEDGARKVLQPRKQPLDFPTPSVSFQPMSILSRILSGATI
jgi:hypothetical protein